MNLFNRETYIARRSTLLEKIETGLVLILGNSNSPRNFLDNYYHFRQDSTMLYYTGLDLPGLSLLLDADSGEVFLGGDELTIDDIVWTGPQPTLKSLAERVGIESVISTDEAASLITNGSRDRTIHFLPPYRGENKIFLSNLLSRDVSDITGMASNVLVDAVISQRSIKSDEEIQQIEEALEITKEMHLQVMYSIKPGLKEADMYTKLMEVAHRHDVQPAYTPIVTINGQTLHNHSYHNVMKPGDLLLGDFGAESSMFYAGDITRTFPVSGSFTSRQKEIYQLVLNAEKSAINDIKPGVEYLEIHRAACLLMAEGLKDLGLMKGDMKEAVEMGAHALFFPHGLGHMLGLDVHDMEDLGENKVGYGQGTERSTMFGYRSLRLGRQLEEGFVLTVEPGLYFIPELIDMWQQERKHDAFIDYEVVQTYRDFGGIRIEDNILVQSEGGQVLGPSIPKEVKDVEFLCALDKYVS